MSELETVSGVAPSRYPTRAVRRAEDLGREASPHPSRSTAPPTHMPAFAAVLSSTLRRARPLAKAASFIRNRPPGRPHRSRSAWYLHPHVDVGRCSGPDTLADQRGKDGRNVAVTALRKRLAFVQGLIQRMDVQPNPGKARHVRQGEAGPPCGMANAANDASAPDNVDSAAPQPSSSTNALPRTTLRDDVEDVPVLWMTATRRALAGATSPFLTDL